MFSFLQVLIAVLIATTESAAPAGESVAREGSLAIILCLLPLPLLWGEWLRRLGSRFWARPLFLLFPLGPVLIYSAVIFLAGWGDLARAFFWPHSELVRLSFMLAPFFVIDFFQVTALYRLERRVVPSFNAYLSSHFRNLLFPLAPVVIYLAAADGLGQFRGLRAFLESLGLARLATTLIFALFLLMILPLAARLLWKTAPLPAGALREKLEELANRFGFRCREILLLKTEGMTVNAAILGLFSRFRYVLLTDGLIGLLTIEEVEAVFGHELGHAKRHHVAIFFCFAMSALFLFLLAADFLLPQEEMIQAAIGLSFLLLWWLMFGYLSRRFELEADLYGAKAAGSLETFLLALEKVGAFSGQGRWHGSWRHFSVAERVEFLRRIQAEPERETRFQRKLQQWTRAALALFCLSGLTYAGLLARQVPLEMVQFDLRMGEYERALRRLEGESQDSPEVKPYIVLAKLGAELRRDQPDSWQAEASRRGQALLLQRDFCQAATYLSLCVLLDEEDEDLSKSLKEAQLQCEEK